MDKDGDTDLEKIDHLRLSDEVRQTVHRLAIIFASKRSAEERSPERFEDYLRTAIRAGAWAAQKHKSGSLRVLTRYIRSALKTKHT